MGPEFIFMLTKDDVTVADALLRIDEEARTAPETELGLNPAALVLGHAGPHLPNNPLVTDADAFSSGHSQGVNFLFGDGSVQSINSSIATNVYDALATRAGKESINENDY